ncbi:MAG: DNA polymerase III subunit delta [Pelolinea sp.]|nr:DNA polymerase III subunit delta [Pelolinea sp.]
MTLVGIQKTTSIPPSKIVILIGDNRLSVEEQIKEISNAVGEGAFSELNNTRLDGSTLGFHEILMQLNVFPLGGGKRIVVLDNASEIIGRKGAEEWLTNILTNVSPTTLLILILEDEKKHISGSMNWKAFSSKHWLRKLSDQYPGDIHWIELSLPSEGKMPEWILKEATDQGGLFHPQAAVELSRLVGNDLFQAKQEIEKAILYVGDEKQVEIDDVRLLCAASQDENIFALVDAVGARNGKLAMSILNKLSKDMPIQYLFSMLVRQVRLLILAKEAILGGGGEKGVLSACGIRHTFIAKKLVNQAHHFSMETLEGTYRKLDHIDEEGKIGHLSLDAALDGLIAEIAA